MNICFPDVYRSHRATSSQGALILSVAHNLGHDVTAFLEEATSDTSEGWYPQERYLPMLDEIAHSKQDAVFDLIGIGIKLASYAPLPADVTTLKRALFSLDDFYHQTNPHIPGGWQVTLVEANFAVCTSSTPFPSDMEYGILYGLADRFLNDEYVFKVTLAATGTSRLKGGTSCTYHVRWWKKDAAQ